MERSAGISFGRDLTSLIRAAVLLATVAQLFAAYAPPRTCATCHAKETARYLATAMGKSLIAPAPLPSGRVTDARSGSVITIEQRDGRMIHALSEGGLTAEYPVTYQIGGGLMGRSYMVQTGDYLFESPASWFNRYGWDLSPGYARTAVIDFDRPVDEACLFCHAGTTRFGDSDGRLLKDEMLTSITCERCHGPSEAHLRRPSAKNILNPAKLTGAARDGVCEQCHLEGATRILNPGKHWSDFHAGESAEGTFATYLLVGGDHADTVAVSQVEQLAQSKCVRATGGKLWCGTCHQPHGEVLNRQREIRAICTSCHTTLAAAAHPTGQAAGQAAVQPECTSCHMPRNSTTDIPHAALTDHRILRRPLLASNNAPESEKVIPWREPAPAVRDRDLALAEVLIGFSKKVQAVGEDGFRLLGVIPAQEVQQDPAVLSDLEGLSLQQQNLQAALQFGRRAVELEPQSAKAAMNLGIVLKRSGDLKEAEQQLTRAIDLDASLKAAYVELATLYASDGRKSETIDTLDRFLKFNPQDIMFRLQKTRMQP